MRIGLLLICSVESQDAEVAKDPAKVKLEETSEMITGLVMIIKREDTTSYMLTFIIQLLKRCMFIKDRCLQI